MHVHPGAEELGRVYRPHLAINAAPTGFRRGARRLAAAERRFRWRDETRSRACRLSRLDREGDAAARRASISARSWCGCASNLPPDAILCNGAGNFSAWMHRFYRFRRFGDALGPTSGSMGYGVPAAVGDEAALSRAHGGLPRRRRRLPDERPGVRDRRAIRPADHHRRSCDNGMLRHHPHASGARISRPRGRRPL